MPDKDTLQFLAGLKVYDADIEVRDDVVVAVATVGGPFVEYHSEEEHASWIVEACHRASRTCETCALFRSPRKGFATRVCICTGYVRDPDEFCSDWQPREAADAER